MTWAGRHWYDEADIHAGLIALSQASDEAFWRGLAESPVRALREIAAINVATPIDALEALLAEEDPDDPMFVGTNPSLGADRLARIADSPMAPVLLNNTAATAEQIARLRDRAIAAGEGLVADACIEWLAARAVRGGAGGQGATSDPRAGSR